MSTERNVTVIFSGVNPLPTSTGIERDSIKDMKIGDRIKAYCVPVGEGDNKSDPYITFDINDALDHIEKYYGKKFGTTITVTCSTDYNYQQTHENYNAANTYDEGATSYTASIGFYAYKVDKGLLMANIWYGSTTMRILNRSNLYSGDGWRLLGPREISKYVLSDLNGTINPKINPWGLPVDYDGRPNSHYSFYQMPHNGSHCFIFVNSSINFGGGYRNRFWNDESGIGWPFIDLFNGSYDKYTSFTSLFLYQYVESENATNIYY